MKKIGHIIKNIVGAVIMALILFLTGRVIFSPGKVNIGIIGSYIGKDMHISINMVNGIKLAYSSFPDKFGEKVKIDIKNDGSDPFIFREIIRSFTKEKKNIIVIAKPKGESSYMADLVNTNIIYILPLIYDIPDTIKLPFGIKRESELIASYFLKTDIKKIAFIVAQTNTPANQKIDSIYSIISKIPIINYEEFISYEDTQILEKHIKKFDAIYFAADLDYLKEVISIIESKKHFNTKIFVDDINMLKENIYIPNRIKMYGFTTFFAYSKDFHSFTKGYISRFHKVPDINSYIGYLTGRLVFDAINRYIHNPEMKLQACIKERVSSFKYTPTLYIIQKGNQGRLEVVQKIK